MIKAGLQSGGFASNGKTPLPLRSQRHRHTLILFAMNMAGAGNRDIRDMVPPMARLRAFRTIIGTILTITGSRILFTIIIMVIRRGAAFSKTLYMRRATVGSGLISGCDLAGF